ncbi:MAG: hypothetical protein LBN33_08945 [Desulfovibrio sp.]|jgi:hypothetical protein|nr:hypothetical protein [Desulfovibrio sp.]
MCRFGLFALACWLCLAAAQPVHAAVTIEVFNPAGVRESGRYVDELLKESMQAQGIAKPVQAASFPKTRIETVTIAKDALEEINTLFYERGWTDGLPIVPPTPERVAAMLQGSDMSADFLIANLAPLNGQASIEKIAVNAVMAGCEPAHMPVLLAAVEAVSQDEFDLRGVATTTNPDAVLLIISGPIVKDLQINDGTNAFGRGTKANSAISRAMHLILQNIGGSWPGVTDMSTMGQPGEIVMLFAENASANPWPPYHTAYGLPASANVVTAAGAEYFAGLLGIGQSRPGYLKLIASWLKGHDRPYRDTVVLVVAQDTAQMLHREGWTREKIRDYIFEHAKVPLREFKEQFIDTNMAKRGVPTWVFEEKDLNRLVPKPFIDHLQIIVAGGTGEKSMIIPCWSAGTPVSREIRLPGNWSSLIGAQ